MGMGEGRGFESEAATIVRMPDNPLHGLDLRTPWKITDTGSAFVVANADGRRVAHFYYRREAALRSEYSSPEEARAYAVAFAGLSRVAGE